MSDNIWVSYRNPDGRTFTIGGSNPDVFFENALGMFDGDREKAARLAEDFQVLADPPAAQAVTNAAPLRAGGAPAAPAAAPPGAPSCQHGVRTYKESFTSRAGKAMPSSWQCTSRDRNDQCKAVWNDN